VDDELAGVWSSDPRTCTPQNLHQNLHLQNLPTPDPTDDLDAFCAKVVEEIAEGLHTGQTG